MHSHTIDGTAKPTMSKADNTMMPSSEKWSPLGLSGLFATPTHNSVSLGTK